ncbi:hypothetical protein CHU98_g12474 [Xylaria longipes]|nr:hypothetical protein CHU98_g12474 [Xylaria longipes]
MCISIPLILVFGPSVVQRLRQENIQLAAAPPHRRTTAWTLAPDIDLKSPTIASLHPRDQHHHYHHNTSSASASASSTTPPLTPSPPSLLLSSPVPTSVSDLASPI